MIFAVNVNKEALDHYILVHIAKLWINIQYKKIYFKPDGEFDPNPEKINIIAEHFQNVIIFDWTQIINNGISSLRRIVDLRNDLIDKFKIKIDESFSQIIKIDNNTTIKCKFLPDSTLCPLNLIHFISINQEDSYYNQLDINKAKLFYTNCNKLNNTSGNSLKTFSNLIIIYNEDFLKKDVQLSAIEKYQISLMDKIYANSFYPILPFLSKKYVQINVNKNKVDIPQYTLDVYKLKKAIFECFSGKINTIKLAGAIIINILQLNIKLHNYNYNNAVYSHHRCEILRDTLTGICSYYYCDFNIPAWFNYFISCVGNHHICLSCIYVLMNDQTYKYRRHSIMFDKIEYIQNNLHQISIKKILLDIHNSCKKHTAYWSQFNKDDLELLFEFVDLLLLIFVEERQIICKKNCGDFYENYFTSSDDISEFFDINLINME